MFFKGEKRNKEEKIEISDDEIVFDFGSKVCADGDQVSEARSKIMRNPKKLEKYSALESKKNEISKAISECTALIYKSEVPAQEI